MEGLRIFLCFIIPVVILMLCRNVRKKAPPGPPSLLFVAWFLALGRSVFQIGPILRSLHARYGPIISIWVGRTFVFVADRRLAHSILIQGGGSFDSRPPATEIMHLLLGHSIATSPYGAYWRLVRRNLHLQALHPSRVRLFAPERQRALDALVGSLRRDYGDGSRVVTVRPLLARCLFELLVCMALGVRLGRETLDEMQEVQLQVLLAVTAFPVFSIFPALTKRLLRRRWAGHLALREKRKELILPLIRAPRGGAARPCYADSLLELRVAEEGGRPLTDDEMVTLCSEFMIAAMDSSLSLMEWIMAELVNHPQVQAKLYEEVARGKPELIREDEDQLQPPAGNAGMSYLKATVLEGLRLHPVAHLLLPHGVETHTEIAGYMVPKGAELNVLIADFGLDETAWTAPREFRPERFLHGQQDLDITGSREIRMAPFGAGRRMCPGYLLAMHHAEFFVGSLVRDFQWLPPAQGQDTVDMAEDLASVITMKHPLRARIIPRT